MGYPGSGGGALGALGMGSWSAGGGLQRLDLALEEGVDAIDVRAPDKALQLGPHIPRHARAGHARERLDRDDLGEAVGPAALLPLAEADLLQGGLDDGGRQDVPVLPPGDLDAVDELADRDHGAARHGGWGEPQRLERAGHGLLEARDDELRAQAGGG